MNNAAFFLCFILCIAFAVAIPWARRNDNLDALEALDDEPIAAEASQAWNRGDWS